MNRAIPELPPGLWRAMKALSSGTEDFVALVRNHRLLPIAANDPALDPELHAAARAAWDDVREAEDLRSRACDEHLEQVFALFAHEEVIYIKGVIFRRTLYPDPSLRAMNDIDVVVRPERAPLIRGRLAAAGYSEKPARYFHHPARFLPIELIPRFAQRSRHAVGHEEVFRQRVTGACGPPRLAEHHALATHALLLGTRIHVHARKLVDHWLLTRDAEVVAQAVETAVRWRMRRVFHAAMVLVARAFPDSATDWRLRMSGSTLSPSERRVIENTVIRRWEFPAPRGIVALKAKRLALLDSNLIRARFVASRLTETITPASLPAPVHLGRR